MIRLKTAQIPEVKQKLLLKQGSRCGLCRINLAYADSKDICLDHCHVTGNVRGVLCRNCNGCEGKVFNLARRAKRDGTPRWWIERLLAYWTKYEEEPTGVYHPTHKTVDEKRVLRNKRAREKRAKSK